ncbi:alpha-amylase [Rubrobacter taiwanensis]|jgi:starch synthase (maltosyl-transferring)|uniref:Alpha-amylase n=1 Tax=Rubrobacter taiwanensis TaxID=185139 RepID=A0A4R1BTZ3_9ACTN|nr:alpha-amylase family glycosyl hydrolase [Rubrobacter taiwanensis]TCJ20766.1 alpha-amylase [Rubrobacter taiwanensis]
MSPGARIYNLFPLLVGSVEDWKEHLPRVAAMEFDWVFLNPFHYPGFSGSLYAVKDYYRLHPMFQGASQAPADELLRDFLDRAEEHGLRVMMDLVINHTAKDSVLVEEHPEWFAREEDGSIRSPRAVDPDDPSNVTVWGDLAEIDYDNPEVREEVVGYWCELVRHYAALGFHGFRCDAAYQVPAEVWAAVISAAREVDPGARFFAETLGCTLEQVAALSAAGFDYLFNSSKWWDFREGWLLEQYESFRRIAPSVSFPESHDTERVGAEANETVARLRYLFAAFFSTGVMMPVGYEFGFCRRLDVVRTRPEDWEEPQYDISDFIRETNRMKSECALLNQEGPQEMISGRDSPVTVLLRRSESGGGVAVGLVNHDPWSAHSFPAVRIVQAAGTYGLSEITPYSEHSPLRGDVHLNPQEMRVFYAEGG